VLNWLWVNTAATDIIDESIQREAVANVAGQQDSFRPVVRLLTVNQAAVLRWITFNPGVSPFSDDAIRKTREA